MDKVIKNIVIVNDFDYIQGGASKVAIETANLIAENYSDIKVYFFSAVHNDDSPLSKKVISITTNQKEALNDKNKIRAIINDLYNFKSKRKLKKLLKTLNKEETIIHVHSWTKALSSSVFHIANKMNYKLVLTMHDYFTACPNGGYFNYKKNEICHLKPLSWKCIKCNCDSRNYAYKIYRIIRQVIQNKIVKLNDNLKYVISLSDFSESILKRTLNKKTKIFRVYNPIDLDEKPVKIDYKKNSYYLYVGRVSKEKGLEVFCDAITQVGLKAIVVGDGEIKEELEKKYKNIEFVGWKDSKEVKKYMKNARVLIFPSKIYECAPLTPLEIMQYDIPVITSDCNAAKDYIENGVNGYIYKDYDELINILTTKIKDEKFKFNLEKYYGLYSEKVLKCYNEIIK